VGVRGPHMPEIPGLPGSPGMSGAPGISGVPGIPRTPRNSGGPGNFLAGSPDPTFRGPETLLDPPKVPWPSYQRLINRQKGRLEGALLEKLVYRKKRELSLFPHFFLIFLTHFLSIFYHFRGHFFSLFFRIELIQ
jgi:hypothetical protein